MAKAPGKGQKMQALYALHWVPKLAPASRTVGAWLIWHANAATGRCDPGQARLRDETGFSRRTIQTAVQQLIELDVVSRKLRKNESSSYEISWKRLSEVVSEYEGKAKSRVAVVTTNQRKERLSKKVGAENCTYQAQEIAPSLAQETAPKLSEVNSGKKPMFRVGVTSEKSEDDVSLSMLRSEAKIEEDDAVGRRILATREDYGFLGSLDREVSAGRRFSRGLAEDIRRRLEEIHEGGDEDHHQGDPILGRAYRLIETEFDREEAA
ncbi:helix-turn-helix domain-containing protein [Neorhizobium sp. LjRoot104]|uniref:helix-turn-helix domain-containing protein n=1 Tax=Neorhizobium sp. LjRoot104 TaxID=3342254 RepID=UPI003ECDCD25